MLQKYRIYYFFLAVMSFIGTLAIIRFAPELSLLRNFGADLLLVVFLYTILSSIMLNWPPEDKAMIIMLVAAIFEGLQFLYKNAEGTSAWNAIFQGATFDWIDLIVIAVAGIFCAIMDYAFINKTPKPVSPAQ